MKRSIKILGILILTLILVSNTLSVFATGATGGLVDPKEIQGTKGNTDSIKNLGNQIIGFVQVVGSVGAVLVLIILGIKYMIGSAEEKAEYKKTMIPYIIGAILVFAASNIAGFIFNFAKGIA